MQFLDTAIAGTYIVEPELRADERGFFARTWSRDEFVAAGLVAEFTQCSVSFNVRRGTLRGMHYQRAPHEETKLVRCTTGRMYDVALDLRPESATCGRWVAAELSSDNHRALYIPRGCAHGFLTLEDDTEVLYQIAGDYVPASAAGVRWNDPAFGIEWPEPVTVIAERDRCYPDSPPRIEPAGE